MNDAAPAIAVHVLTKRYGKRAVVDHVDLTVPRGRIVGRSEFIWTVADTAPGADEDHGDLRDLGELHGVVYGA